MLLLSIDSELASIIEKEAFKFNANLSDRDIRQIRATAQGMTTYQYESFLKEIGIEYEWYLDQKVMSLKASYQT